MTTNLTREQCIKKALTYLDACGRSEESTARATYLAAMAQAYLLAAQTIPAKIATPEDGDSAIETLPLAAKRDGEGDLWISYDGETWSFLSEVLTGREPLSSRYGPYIDVRIVPLTS